MHADFPYKGRSASVGRRTMFFATILVVVILILDLLTGGKVRALVQTMVSPIWRVGEIVWNDITKSGYFSTRVSLEAQINVLQDELAQAQLNSAAYGIVQQENTQLAQVAHLAANTPGIAAPIVSSLQSSPYGTFLVGAGSSDGLAVGSLVLTADPASDEAFVIGRVSEVQSHTSLVDELFAPGASIDVMIDGASVSASGQGGENAHASVPHGVTIMVGDPVIAPEYDGRSVGIVGNVAADPASAQSEIYIALPMSFSSLRYVYITP